MYSSNNWCQTDYSPTYTKFFFYLVNMLNLELLTNGTIYVGNWPVNTDSLSGIYTGLYMGKTCLIRLLTGLYTAVGMHT
jgi:hypothetical protein